MQLHIIPHKAAASPYLPLTQAWQTLLIYLLKNRYGLVLNGTSFNDDVNGGHIDADILMCDTLSFIVGKYDVACTDRHCVSYLERSPYLQAAGIFLA